MTDCTSEIGASERRRPAVPTRRSRSGSRACRRMKRNSASESAPAARADGGRRDGAAVLVEEPRIEVNAVATASTRPTRTRRSRGLAAVTPLRWAGPSSPGSVDGAGPGEGACGRLLDSGLAIDLDRPDRVLSGAWPGPPARSPDSSSCVQVIQRERRGCASASAAPESAPGGSEMGCPGRSSSSLIRDVRASRATFAHARGGDSGTRAPGSARDGAGGPGLAAPAQSSAAGCPRQRALNWTPPADANCCPLDVGNSRAGASKPPCITAYRHVRPPADPGAWKGVLHRPWLVTSFDFECSARRSRPPESVVITPALLLRPGHAHHPRQRHPQLGLAPPTLTGTPPFGWRNKHATPQWQQASPTIVRREIDGGDLRFERGAGIVNRLHGKNAGVVVGGRSMGFN